MLIFHLVNPNYHLYSSCGVCLTYDSSGSFTKTSISFLSVVTLILLEPTDIDISCCGLVSLWCIQKNFSMLIHLNFALYEFNFSVMCNKYDLLYHMSPYFLLNP